MCEKSFVGYYGHTCISPFFFKFIYLGFSSFFGLTLSPITMCARLQILQEEKKTSEDFHHYFFFKFYLYFFLLDAQKWLSD